MKNTCLGFFFLFVSILQPLAAQSFPSLDPDPKALEYAGRAKNGLSWEDLAEISLWASGANPLAPVARGKPSYLDTIKNAAHELLNDPDLPADQWGRGEYIQTFMFKKFLKTYSEKQTRVDIIINNGSYNCVSSAVLYAIFAKAAGLDVLGVVTRDHAFVKALIGDEEVDVETTNPYGFDPGNRRDFHDGFGKVTGFAYVPARNYRDRADVNTLELVSLIFNNRITELETRSRFADSIPLALNRAALLSNPTNTVYSEFFVDPQKMAMDRIFNYGAGLIKAGKENDALAWAALAEPRYPDFARWQEFINAVVNNLLVKLVKAKRFDEARIALTANAARISPENFTRLDAMLAETDITRIVNAVKTLKDADTALAALDNAPPSVPADKLREMRLFTIMKKSELIAKEQGWLEAIAFTEDARAAYGPDPRMDEHLRAFRTNRVADLHNAFADAYNGRDMEKARAIIQDALLEFPENRQLLQDKDLADRGLR
jgi:tetratricopeptide (TPR) repeat protein